MRGLLILQLDQAGYTVYIYLTDQEVSEGIGVMDLARAKTDLAISCIFFDAWHMVLK